jgi:hypothetical protein
MFIGAEPPALPVVVAVAPLASRCGGDESPVSLEHATKQRINADAESRSRRAVLTVSAQSNRCGLTRGKLLAKFRTSRKKGGPAQADRDQCRAADKAVIDVMQTLHAVGHRLQDQFRLAALRRGDVLPAVEDGALRNVHQR